MFSLAVPSRSSSVQSLSTSSNNPSLIHLPPPNSVEGGGAGIGGGGFVDPARDLVRMRLAEEGGNNRSIVDENLERNMGLMPGKGYSSTRVFFRPQQAVANN